MTGRLHPQVAAVLVVLVAGLGVSLLTVLQRCFARKRCWLAPLQLGMGTGEEEQEDQGEALGTGMVPVQALQAVSLRVALPLLLVAALAVAGGPRLAVPTLLAQRQAQLEVLQEDGMGCGKVALLVLAR